MDGGSEDIFQQGIKVMRTRRQIQRGVQEGTQMMKGNMGMMGDKSKPMPGMAKKIKKMKKKHRTYSKEAVKMASDKAKA